jgi:hypothetical protein
MGHANAQTTMIYNHQGLEQLRNVIDLRNAESARAEAASKEAYEIPGAAV